MLFGARWDPPEVLRELAEVIAKLLSVVSQWSWSGREVPGDWRLVNMMPIVKKIRNQNLGNYRPDLGSGVSYETDHLERDQTAGVGQLGGDQGQPARVHKG